MGWTLSVLWKHTSIHIALGGVGENVEGWGWPLFYTDYKPAVDFPSEAFQVRQCGSRLLSLQFLA